MFKDIHNFEDNSVSENFQDEVAETTNNTSFHPIIGLFNYDGLENNENCDDCPNDNSYTFPVLMFADKQEL
jgi:hypothetical protein